MTKLRLGTELSREEAIQFIREGYDPKTLAQRFDVLPSDMRAHLRSLGLGYQTRVRIREDLAYELYRDNPNLVHSKLAQKMKVSVRTFRRRLYGARRRRERDIPEV